MAGSSLPPPVAGEASVTAREAHSAARATPSSDSADSYNGDDARRFLRERNETRDLYSEATREVGWLENCLEAIQAAPSAAEGETSAAWALLADADARVTGQFLFLDRTSFSSTSFLSASFQF
jgi:hypothetical protein